MRRLRLVLIGAGIGIGCTALAALFALLPAGWNPRRFEWLMLVMSIVALVISLASLLSSGALGRWTHRGETAAEWEERADTTWVLVPAAVTVFGMWLALGQ